MHRSSSAKQTLAHSLVGTALLLAAPLVTLAQTPARRLYAGLAVYTGANQSLLGWYGDKRVVVPVQATLGYQLRPRLALQFSLAYSGQKSSFSDAYDYLDANGLPKSYSDSYTFSRRATSASLLARYTLTRQASHRFQVDAVGGVSLDHLTFRNAGATTYTSQGTSEAILYDYKSTHNSLRINLGPSFRYRFTERLEAVGDVLFNVSLTTTYSDYNTAVALGLRYRFGQPL